jgi:hypothetical protein
MRFSLNGYAAEPIGAAIRQAAQAYGMGPMVKQQAYQQSALNSAQAYQAQMAANKSAGEEYRRQAEYDARQRIIDEANKGEDRIKRTIAWHMQAFPEARPDQISKSNLDWQSNGLRDEAHKAINSNPALARALTAQANGNFAPIQSLGTTGYGFDPLTGQGIKMSPSLAAIYGGEKQAQNTDHYASAARQRAQAYQAYQAGNKYQAEASPVWQNNQTLNNARFKNLADYEKKLNERIGVGNRVAQKLNAQTELMKQFTPGAGVEVREKLARMAQAIGVPNFVVDGIAGGDLGAVQAFQKTAVQGAMEQLRQSMESGSRVAMQEFLIFQKNNPNITTDPRAIEKVYALSSKMHQADVEELKHFDTYLQSNEDPRRWFIRRQELLEQQPQAVDNAMPLEKEPPIGYIRNGYRYLGGDSADAKSWEPVL